MWKLLSREKTCWSRGGTNGLGLVTARELARMGAQVTIVSRNPEKCAAVAETIKTETGNPVEFIAADLSTLAGIMQAAATFKQRHTRLHVLVNNAGAMFTRRRLTSDGYEMTFALNHLNYFLLTNLLLDILKASAPARIVNVSSRCPCTAPRSILTTCREKNISHGMQAYGQSKLANVLFTYELARRLEGSGVTANALHPGFIATGFARNNGVFYNFGHEGHRPVHPQTRPGRADQHLPGLLARGGRNKREILRRLQSRQFQSRSATTRPWPKNSGRSAWN